MRLMLLALVTTFGYAHAADWHMLPNSASRAVPQARIAPEATGVPQIINGVPMGARTAPGTPAPTRPAPTETTRRRARSLHRRPAGGGGSASLRRRPSLRRQSRYRSLLDEAARAFC